MKFCTRSRSRYTAAPLLQHPVLLFRKSVIRYLVPTVTVKLSEPEFARLEAMAAGLKRTKSDVLREALKTKARDRSLSLLEAMRPYIGKLSGPGDLSTNKARMKGYGKTRAR